ncbi:MAG: recombinase family protein [Lachnospiraceae bacterium]|nr:recombinase family protein [Lachnospiraceae bacterium]
MSHTPYGYRIENGQAVIDEDAAEKLRTLYENYLSGLSLSAAAEQAGIPTYHGTVKLLLRNRNYLGDDFYPALIDQATYDAVGEELQRRAEKLGRTDRRKPHVEKPVPTRFVMRAVERLPPDPIEQAEYLYSLIETEE